jgi:alpha-L-fucosidase
MKKQVKGVFGGVKDVRPYESTDIRFTSKDQFLYAFCMGVPTEDVKITSLGKTSKLASKKIKTITLLGSDEKIKWKQEDDALVITKPSKLPEWQVVTFKMEFKK